MLPDTARLHYPQTFVDLFPSCRFQQDPDALVNIPKADGVRDSQHRDTGVPLRWKPEDV